MKAEFELRLQAYLDGELGGREAAEVEAQVKAQPAAQDLLAELRRTRDALHGNEPERLLPETREFYWHKIERAIEAADRSGARSGVFSLGWLWRYWPQLSGAVTAAVVLLAAGVHFHWFSHQGWEDIENPLAETGTFCFRSEPDRMTLVWVYDRESEYEDLTDAVN